jgi:hypothetical protein
MLINALVHITQGTRTSDVSSRDVVLVALVLDSLGAVVHANASNDALTSFKSAVLKSSVNS